MKVNKGGRPRRYDLSELSVGHSVVLEWPAGLLHSESSRRAREAVHQAVRREARRLGRTFVRVGRPTGLCVTRTA